MTVVDTPLAEAHGRSTSSAMRDIARRVGGPNAVTVPAFVISLGFTLVFGLVGSALGGTGLSWVLPATVGQCSAYGLLWLARGTVLRGVSGRPKPGRTLACFAVAAAVGGSISGAVARASSSADRQPTGPPPAGAMAVLAIVSMIVAFTVVSSFSAVVVDAWRGHRAWSAQRRTAMDRLAYLRRQASDEMDRARQRHRAVVREELEALRHAAPSAPLSTLPAMFRRVAFEVVRPMSHQLTSEVTADIPATAPSPSNLRDFVHDLAGQALVRPLALTLLSLVPGGVFIALNGSAVSAFAFIGITAASLFTAASITAWAIRTTHDRSRRLLWWLLGLVVSAAALPTVAWRAVDDTDLRAAAVITAYSMLCFGLCGPTWHVARMAIVAGEIDRGRLLRAIEAEETLLRQNHRIEQDRLAKALHGKVQASLLACALGLSALPADADDDPDETATRARLDRVLSDLLAGLDHEPEVAELLDGVRKLCETWNGLCEIVIDEDDLVRQQLPIVTNAAVLRVVGEFVTNAIVHGGARHAELAISIASDKAVHVEVVTDGADAPGGQRGLGSAILDELALSWEVVTTPRGVVSRAVVPVAAERSVDPWLPRTS